ncbi:MAG TPA: hypothetical protein VL574_17520 [Stellaceae bacterium]|jgi:hypothetical protein|nr:hypothetical protein [Stellaceae bacterium]
MVVLRIIGLALLVLGLVWIGQGTGYFPYPKTSFMIDQMPWAYRGAGVAVAGLLLILIGRRRRTRGRGRGRRR